MSANESKIAILYNFINHWSCDGDVFRFGNKDYFFRYTIFPHGHLDCTEGTLYFDQQVCDKVEMQRKIAFETNGTPSRGVHEYTRIIVENGTSFAEKLDKNGKVFRQKISECGENL